MRLLLAAALGFLGWRLYRSERAREVRQRLSGAPDSLRQVTRAAASVTAVQAERVAGDLAGAPLPGPLKATVSRLTTTVRTAAEKAGGAVAVGSPRTATVQLQELQDGSWVGDAACGGRTLHEGGSEAQAVIRRLAAHLAALPESERPDRVKLIRVANSGAREERMHDLADLLG